MKILVSAYAAEPGAGSEYGVGWMVPLTMAARYPSHEVWVVTRSRCKEKIELALQELGFANLHYLFYDLPSWMTVKNEMKSKWGEQINYLLWQLKVRRFVRQQHKSVGFDIFHHLTFNQYRTPSPGYWLDIPFVVGPVGGAETVAPAFWQDLETHSQKKECIRQKGADLMLFRWFNNRRNNRKLILCSGGENLRRLKNYVGMSALRLMPAIGFTEADFPTDDIPTDNTDALFEMLYAGKAWDWKGIRIFLRAVKQALTDRDVQDFRVKLVGIRFEDEQRKVAQWIDELQLTEQVEVIPFMQRDELLKMERTCSLSVYPAFRDSGSMSVLEACALSCPTICFNTGGQDIFPDDILLKVEVAKTYDKCVERFADKIFWAYSHRTELKEVGKKARRWAVENLTWENKVDQLMGCYVQLTQEKGDTSEE